MTASLDQRICMAQLGELGLDDETQRLFLSENAARVFRLT